LSVLGKALRMRVLAALSFVEIFDFSERRWSVLSAAIVMLIKFDADKDAFIRGKHWLSIETSGCVQSDIKNELGVPFICRSARITFINRPDDVISSNSNLRVALELS
jgi:hypothetical protein